MDSLDIRALARNGVLDGVPLKSAGVSICAMAQTHVMLAYTESGTCVHQQIELEATPCNYGGERFWWLCPDCARRCAILYRLTSGFSCQSCCNLTHTTSQASPLIRNLRKANKLTQRLRVEGMEQMPGGSGGVATMTRPKGMHQRTFERLTLEMAVADGAAWESLAPILERCGLADLYPRRKDDAQTEGSGG